MKEKARKIICCLLTLVLTASMLSGLSRLVERKGSYTKNYAFLDQEADFDVLFFGSSKIINGVFPMELWNDYGIVSYNLGGHGIHLPTSYWIIQNALDYKEPELIVVDCFTVHSNAKIDKAEYLHSPFDIFPISKNKVAAIWDLIQEPGEDEDSVRNDRMELLWGFSSYHNRWPELTALDFQPVIDGNKGAEPRIGVAVPEKMDTISPDEKMSKETAGLEYLIRIIELCQERNIKLLLINVPFPTNSTVLKAANTVYDIAEEYGVNYINFFDMDLVDYNTDCYDPKSHLNPSGARKVTKYLGEYIRSHYDIPDQRNNPAYTQWHEDSIAYFHNKANTLGDQKSLHPYLMLLADDDFSYIMDIEKILQEKSEPLFPLLRNLGLDPHALTEHCIVVADRGQDTVEIIRYEDLLEGPVETSLGTLTAETNDQQTCLMLNGQQWCAISSNPQERYDVSVGLFSKTGTYLSASQFHFA